MLGSVARPVQRHLDKGCHARGQLDKCRQPRNEANEQRVGLEGGHIDITDATVALLHEQAADRVDLLRNGSATAEGQLGYGEGQVLLLHLSLDASASWPI